MSEITDADRYRWLRANGVNMFPANSLIVFGNACQSLPDHITEAEIDAAIRKEREPVVERSTWQNVYKNGNYLAQNKSSRAETDTSSNARIAVLRRDFWSDGTVTCELEEI